MNKIITTAIHLSMAAVLVISLVKQASAITFVDDATTTALWHMDTIDSCCNNSFVNDDNSTGRAARTLRLRPFLDSGTPPQGTMGALDQGQALLFDGVDDEAFATGVWDNPVETASIDFLMRPDGLPDLTVASPDNFMALVGVLPLQTYWQADESGNGTGNVMALAFYENGVAPGFAIVKSQTGLAVGDWHEVSVDVSNNGGGLGLGSLSMTVNGVTNAVAMDDLLDLSSSLARLGRQVSASARFYEGALDEVRIATTLSISVGIPGDFDDDDDVDGFDFLIWQRDPSIGSLSDWQNNFGRTSSTVNLSAIPEPSSLGLALLGLVLLSLVLLDLPMIRPRQKF